MTLKSTADSRDSLVRMLRFPGENCRGTVPKTFFVIYRLTQNPRQ